MLTLALHAGTALHKMYAKPLNCVTDLKANESGRLVTGVTLVTPVTPVLEGARYVLSYCPSKLALHHIVDL